LGTSLFVGVGFGVVVEKNIHKGMRVENCGF